MALFSDSQRVIDLIARAESAEKRAEKAEAKYDRLLDRYSGLVDKMVTMRRKQGFDPKMEPVKPTMQRDARQSDKEIVDEAAEIFVSRAARELEEQGVDPKAAKAEALRIREEVTSTTIHAGA